MEVVLSSCKLWSYFCVFLRLFQKIGYKIYQINKNRKLEKLRKSKINGYDVINHNFPLNLYEVIDDVTA